MDAPEYHDEKSRRLQILSAAEIAAIYDLPQFTAEERRQYFTLTANEKAALA